MKGLLKLVGALSVWELCGRYPVTAGVLMLLGVGGGVVASGALTPPSITPQPSTSFSQSQTYALVNNGLKTNGGTAGAEYFPSTPTNSFFWYVEGQIDPNDTGFQYALGVGGGGQGLIINAQNNGSPSFVTQKSVSGGNFWQAIAAYGYGSGPTASAGTNWNKSYYPFATAGGGCTREPSGWIGPGATGAMFARLSDPGFQCSTTPSVSYAAVPGGGAQQTGTISGCTSNSPVAGEIQVTITVPIAHGLVAGQTFVLSSSSPTRFNATYTALQGTGGTTLIGETTTGGGTCPASSGTTTAFSGTGGSISLYAISTTNPFGTNQTTGITAPPGQKFCGIVGEYGADSSTPGFQFAAFADQNGNSLPGSPAVSTWPNQGSVNFTGYTTTSAQPELTVTAMNATSVTSATWNAASAPYTSGYVVFALPSSPGLTLGSEFTVSGMTPSAYNGTYIASPGTSGSTVYGNPLSGPLGSPQALANPGSAGSGGQLVGVIVPSMAVLGATGSAVVMPYGTSGSTGTGGAGTYVLSSTQTTFSVSVTSITAPSGGSSTMTVTGTPSASLVVGQSLTIPGYANPVVITALGTGTGASGTYTVSNSNSGSIGSVTATAAGAIGSSGSPVNIFAWSSFYYTGAASSFSGGGALTQKTAATIGDYFSYIAAYNALQPPQFSGWGGSLANIGMYYGLFPSTNSQPSTAALASLCTKTIDFQNFASASGLTVHSLYRLNDPGIWGDSSIAQFTGSIAGTALTISSTQSGSTSALAVGTVVAGAGVTGCPSACPTIASGSGSSYTLSASGGTVSSEPMTAGAYKPAAPVAGNGFNGFISGNALTVTSVASGNYARFTGSTSVPTNSFTGAMAANSNVLTVSGTVTPTNSMFAGQLITDAGSFLPANTYIIQFCSGTNTPVAGCTTGSGGTGGYILNFTNGGTAISAEAMTSVVGSPTNANGGILTPTILSVSSIASGTIAKNMVVTDNGANIGAQPLFVTGTGTVGSTPYTVNPNYYAPIASETMYGTSTFLVPGQYLTGNSSITLPIKIVAYETGANAPGLCPGTSATPYAYGCGTYQIYNPGSLTIGSSGSPAAFTTTGASDGGAVAPGPALTINDPGPGLAFPVTNYGAKTGAVWVSGTYNTTDLGGTPSAIQAQVSYTAGGPPLVGCSACAWTNLADATLTGGNWSGQALNIPAGGPYYISVRAANGTSYATLPNQLRVGLVFDAWGVGQSQNVFSSNGGWFYATTPYLWGQNIYGPSTFNYYDDGPVFPGTNMLPTWIQMLGGDQFAVTGTVTGPLSEGVAAMSNELSAAMGLNTTFSNWTRDGVGLAMFWMGAGLPQSDTVGVGNGSSTTWCSASKFCSNVGTSGPLITTLVNSAFLSGAYFQASISGNTLTVGSSIATGALSPGLVLSDSSFAHGNGLISGSPTLTACLTNCSGNGASSTWTISGASQGTIASEFMRADPAGGAGAPNYSFLVPVTTFGYTMMEAGTFSVSVNGAVQCTDSNTAVYSVQGGNCTGGTVSSAFVNYVTGDYQINFSTAPASGAAVTVSWKEITSPDNPQYVSIFNNIDYAGNGSPTSGVLSAAMARTPGGTSGHILAACLDETGTVYDMGYGIGGVAYTQAVSWFYGVKIPSMMPWVSASTPLINENNWRGDGPSYYTGSSGGLESSENNLCDQWSNDDTNPSSFTGSITAAGGSSGAWTGTLTLGGAATGQMWEGEVIGCATPSLLCPVTPGTYIQSLASGAWGASGSTYNLANNTTTPVYTTSSQALANALLYQAGPSIYAGPVNDDVTGTPNGALNGAYGYTPHPGFGFTGPRRIASRLAAAIYGGFEPGATVAEPTLDRVKGDYSGCDTSATYGPCFDVGNTYAASASGTITGKQIVFSSGISAHARPFVVGQVLSCTGCATNQVITSISVPPTQSTAAGTGEVGQSFTVTASGSLLTGPTTETVTAGCSGAAGTGSNCIDFVFKINTTGTYGTAAALATCGEGNLNGPITSTGWYMLPNGTCSSNGIGSLVRNFRIGTVQAMNGGVSPATYGVAGSPYDDGVDLYGGAFNQSAAFTCNIVAATVVQCVKGAAYSGGVFSSVGAWNSGSTYAEYGDAGTGTARMGSLLGNVGGQPFAFTTGSGYTNGTYTIALTNCALGTGGSTIPKVDVTVSGGSIVNAYGSTATAALGNAIGYGCTVPLTALGAGTAGSVTIPTWPNEGSYGIAAFNNSVNMMGDMLYDNSGFPGNPLNTFFTNGLSGYFEPGMPVRPFGEFMGVEISG